MTKSGWVLLALVATNGCALETATSGRVVIGEPGAPVETHFSTSDRTIIKAYYRHHPVRSEAAPPGLARYRRLPPGARVQDLPPDLEDRLSVLPSRYVRLRVDDTVILLDRARRTVLDIVDLVR